MSAPWRITNRGTSGTAATATRAVPADGLTTGLTIRLRSLQCTLSGSSAGTDELVVRDGASGAGTIIASFDLAIPANGSAFFIADDLDLRASLGNALTVEFVNGATSDTENVNAQGDYVPPGYPAFMD